MNYRLVFSISLFSFACVSGLAAVWAVRQSPAKLAKWEPLPRNILFGVILAGVDLAWCVPESHPLVPDGMQSWLIPLAVASLWIVYQFLDYIFSRALGGFLILFAHYLLYASFAYKAPLAPLLSGFCFAMGTLGIFFCGKPHLMRDLIRKISASRKWSYSFTAIFAAYSLLFLLTGLLFVKNT
ncbi:MAG: hypothetical protein GXP32_00570 [Kiritimatiellaeota bacterium]|nr:hypothetical protein [Kiritimatiellota bacterium]